jgi:hypothetical protein
MIVRIAGQDVTLVERYAGVWVGEIGPLSIELDAPDPCVRYWSAHLWVTAEGSESCTVHVDGNDAQDAADVAVRCFRDDAREWADETRREYEGLAAHALAVEKQMRKAQEDADRVEALLGGRG